MMTQQETRDRIVGRMRAAIHCLKDGQYIDGAIIDGLYEVGVEIADEISGLRAELVEFKKSELARIMSDISEEHWAAGWLISNEFALWRMVSQPRARRDYGMGKVTKPEIRTMKALSDAIGGWVTGDGFVPMAEWLEMFRVYEASHASARQ